MSILSPTLSSGSLPVGFHVALNLEFFVLHLAADIAEEHLIGAVRARPLVDDSSVCRLHHFPPLPHAQRLFLRDGFAPRVDSPGQQCSSQGYVRRERQLGGAAPGSLWVRVELLVFLSLEAVDFAVRRAPH